MPVTVAGGGRGSEAENGSGSGNGSSGSPLAGALIAGGKSTRFGQDKASLQFQDRSLAARLLDALRLNGLSPLVHNGPRMPSDVGPDVRLLPDRQAGLGPLGGLATLLQELDCPVLVVACDMPGLNPEAVAALKAAYLKKPGKGGLVAEGGGGLQPLFAVYEPSLLPAIQAALAGGQKAVYRLADSEGLPHFPLPEEDWVRNVNTLEEWARWVEENS